MISTDAVIRWVSLFLFIGGRYFVNCFDAANLRREKGAKSNLLNTKFCNSAPVEKEISGGLEIFF